VQNPRLPRAAFEIRMSCKQINIEMQTLIVDFGWGEFGKNRLEPKNSTYS
jgi:hypothetical protein